MPEELLITANGRTLTASWSSSAAYQIVEWKWPAPRAKRRSMAGRYGSRPLGPGDFEDRTITVEVTRLCGPGDGIEQSQAWFADLSEIAGAVSESEDATLRRTLASGETRTFSISDVQAEPAETARWDWGYAHATLTITAEAVAYGETEDLEMSSTLVDGVPVWKDPSHRVKGDLAAHAEITAEWADTRREALCIAGDGDQSVTVLDPVALLASWGPLPSGNGQLTSACVGGGVPIGRFDVANFATTQAGRFVASLRVRLAATSPIQSRQTLGLALKVNGSVAARSGVVMASLITPQPWVIASFGSLSVRAGDVVTLEAENAAAGSAPFGDLFASLFVEQLCLFPAEGSTAAVVTRGDEIGFSSVKGDTFSTVYVPGGLNARAGDLGATWASNAWNVGFDGDGYAYNGADAAARATLPAVTLPARFDVRLAVDVAGLEVVNIGLLDAADMGVRLRRFVSAQNRGRVEAKTSTHSSIPFQEDNSVLPNGALTDVTVQIDEAGRYWVWEGQAGLRQRLCCKGHVPSLTSLTLKPTIVVENGAGFDAKVRSAKVTQGQAVHETITWSNESSDLARGDFPTLIPGRLAMACVRAGVDIGDAPATQGPTAVEVSYTPLYLSMPN